uniref:Uncharacterized protein n=1 Tax=Anguilla anguilla TaxID=7936 RepID=A0A0E9TKY7_ANGAN
MYLAKSNVTYRSNRNRPTLHLHFSSPWRTSADATEENNSKADSSF